MALVYLRLVEDGQAGNGYVINTKNIETILELRKTSIPNFMIYLMNGEDYEFNQIYIEGKFINVYKMDQLYKLLTKLDRGEIQNGSS